MIASNLAGSDVCADMSDLLATVLKFHDGAHSSFVRGVPMQFAMAAAE
jgi:hypothetical protein